MKSKVTKASGNIFEDLGFDKEEALNLKIRAEMMIAIKKHINQHELTQAQAAKKMGIDQPRLNKLLKGKIELFTIDALVKMLERAGIHVSVKLVA